MNSLGLATAHQQFLSRNRAYNPLVNTPACEDTVILSSLMRPFSS